MVHERVQPDVPPVNTRGKRRVGKPRGLDGGALPPYTPTMPTLLRRARLGARVTERSRLRGRFLPFLRGRPTSPRPNDARAPTPG